MSLEGNEYSRIFVDKYFSHTLTSDVIKIPRYTSLSSIGDEPGMEGDIILDRFSQQFCFHDGQMWHCISVGGEDVTLTNLCSSGVSLVGGNGIVEQGPALRIKGLSQGSGIILSNTANCVTISTNIALTNACASAANGNLVVVGTGSALAIKGLLAGNGISVDTAANCITINSTLTNACNAGNGNLLVLGTSMAIKGLVATDTGITISNLGNCIGLGSNITLTNACVGAGNGNLVSVGTGPNLAIKGLLAGNGIVIQTPTANCVTISSNITLTNVCENAIVGNLIVTGAGPNMAIKGLLPGSGISLSSNTTCVTINANTTTLTNACSSAIVGNLIVTGAGPNMAIKGLLPGSGISLSSNTTCVTINADTTTLTNACLDSGNVSLVASAIGPGLQVKGLLGSNGIDITSTPTCVQISSNIILNTACQTQGAANLVADGVGPVLAIKGLIAGNGVTINDTANCVTISTINADVTLTNSCLLPNVANFVQNGTGPNLQIRGLITGNGLIAGNSAACVVMILDPAYAAMRTVTGSIALPAADIEVPLSVTVAFNATTSGNSIVIGRPGDYSIGGLVTFHDPTVTPTRTILYIQKNGVGMEVEGRSSGTSNRVITISTIRPGYVPGDILTLRIDEDTAATVDTFRADFWVQAVRQT